MTLQQQFDKAATEFEEHFARWEQTKSDEAMVDAHCARMRCHDLLRKMKAEKKT